MRVVCTCCAQMAVMMPVVFSLKGGLSALSAGGALVILGHIRAVLDRTWAPSTAQVIMTAVAGEECELPAA